MTVTVRRVGRISVAVGLVALGFGLLLDNLMGAAGYTSLVLRFWPILLIGVGVEYLIYAVLDKTEEGQPVRLRFDWGGAILLALVIGLTAGVRTLSTWVSLDPRDYVVAGAAGSRSETSALPVEDARAVEIEVGLGRVELYSQKLREVRVEATYSMHGGLLLRDQAGLVQDFRLVTDTDGSTVRVQALAPTGVNLGSISASYKVYLPPQMEVRLRIGAGSVIVRDYEGQLTIINKVGAINVAASSGKLDLESGSGSITVGDHRGAIIAKANVGRIDVRRVDGSLQLDSGTGSIYVEEYTGGKLVAETRTGSINVSSRSPLEDDLLLRTSTGSINLTLPAESSMKVTARTRTGSISAPPFVAISQAGTGRTAVGTSGEGRHVVTLETGTGSIHFTTAR